MAIWEGWDGAVPELSASDYEREMGKLRMKHTALTLRPDKEIQRWGWGGGDERMATRKPGAKGVAGYVSFFCT